MNIKTVGDLKKALEHYDNNLAIGGYDGQDYIDYKSVDIYIMDREMELRTDIEDLRKWWSGEPPKRVLVFDIS